MNFPSFDELKSLHEKDPEEYEKYTRGLIADYIDSVEDEGKKKRLQQQQFVIDSSLMKIKNPLSRASKAFSMMVEDGLHKLNDAYQGTPPPPKKNSKVIQFKKKC